MLTHLKNLIRPKEMEVDASGNTYAKITVEPLERGYGTTLGNAMRRTLLSSIPGSAITGIRADGALHEFTTLANVVEDMATLILNVKGINIKVNDQQDHTLRIDVEGPARVTAADITPNASVEVLNPDQFIATVNEGGKMSLELVTGNGRGYVPADENKNEDDPADRIAIDALFSPIRRVNYRIASARVGQHTDYDKLVLEVWTNGAVTPEEAVNYASAILRDQFRVFLGDEDLLPEEVDETEATEAPALSENLYRSVEELDLSVRAANCLKNANIHYIGELVQKSEDDLLKTKNFGRKSLKEIKERLAELSLTLSMELEGFDPQQAEEMRQQA